MGFKVVFNYYIHQETLVDLAKEKKWRHVPIGRPLDKHGRESIVEALKDNQDALRAFYYNKLISKYSWYYIHIIFFSILILLV